MRIGTPLSPSATRVMLLGAGEVVPALEFGDDNLQLFVRYHGLYDDIVHDVNLFDQQFCARDGEKKRSRRLGRMRASSSAALIEQPLRCAAHVRPS